MPSSLSSALIFSSFKAFFALRKTYVLFDKFEGVFESQINVENVVFFDDGNGVYTKAAMFDKIGVNAAVSGIVTKPSISINTNSLGQAQFLLSLILNQYMSRFCLRLLQ